jgi:hypothetical protein
VPRLIELHPRPGGCEIPYLGIVTGAGNLIDCYRRMLRDEELPPPSHPTSWVYQRYTKAHPFDEEQKRTLWEKIPSIEFIDEKPTSDGDEITETGDWDMFMRTRADSEGEIRAHVDLIEAVVFPRQA